MTAVDRPGEEAQWPPSDNGPWPPVYNSMMQRRINRHFASIEELEAVQAQRCVALRAQPALVRSTTLFHWWPQRLQQTTRPQAEVV
jgi:hypothetical protein